MIVKVLFALLVAAALTANHPARLRNARAVAIAPTQWTQTL